MRKPTIKGIAAVAAWITGFLLLSVVAVLVWSSWITPFERVAMRRALTDIEAVQKMHGDEVDYAVRVSAAKASVASCKSRVISEYDSRITMLIEMDLQDTVLRQRINNLPDSDRRKAIMMTVVSKKDGSADSMLRRVVE